MNEVVVGIDGSKAAHHAAERAADMATRYGYPLHIVMAVPQIVIADMGAGMAGAATMYADSAAAAEKLVAAAAEEFARSVGQVTSAVVMKEPATALCDEAERISASCIVVGNKRVQGMARLLGSVAGGVAKSAPCDVLVVHTY
jgi:nucleotide-binding universal stress UspA family protein